MNVLLAELDVHVGPVRLELRNRTRYFDGLRDSAELKLGVDVGCGVRGNCNTGDVVGFEASGLDVNLVGIGN